jgi:predicted TIM-barrel fold metal-dependent hydrolase
MTRPGDATRTANYVVVSADSHVGPKMDTQLREYCPKEHLEDYNAWLAEVEEELRNPGPSFVSKLPDQVRSYAEHRGQEDGAWDIDVRLARMDEDGVAAEVMYHGTGVERIPFNRPQLVDIAVNPQVTGPQMEAVGVRMYNRWLADAVSTAPARLIGLAQLPLASPLEVWVDEVRWAKSAGLRGVNLPAPRTGQRQYFDPYWEPLWSVCEELQMSLNTHSGSGDVLLFNAPPEFHYMYKQFETGYFGRRHVHQMVLSGVFERHPSLKLAITEQAGHWVQGEIRDMESSYVQRWASDLRKDVKKRPREVWATNCFVGASMMSDTEARLGLEPGGLELNLMWGRDYPHLEGTWPFTKKCMRKTFGGLPPEIIRPLIGGNAIRLYDLDIFELQPIADKIGPTVGDLAEPLPAEEVPSDEEYQGFGFRTIGQWG